MQLDTIYHLNKLIRLIVTSRVIIFLSFGRGLNLILNMTALILSLIKMQLKTNFNSVGLLVHCYIV